jgi:hypothetical protein
MYSNLWIACDNDKGGVFPIISDRMPIKYKSGICRSFEGNQIIIPFHRPKIPITFAESPKKINVKLDPNGEFWVARDTLPGYSFSL